MSLLPAWDTFTLKRTEPTSDTEGNAFNGVMTIGSGTGVYGSANSREQMIAAQRGDPIDAYIATNMTGIKAGDIIDCRGRTWTVVSVKDVRLHNRVAIRITDEMPGS